MRKTIIAFLSALFLPVMAMAQSYDAVADWNPSTNTTANVWQYGTDATLGGAVTLFSTHGTQASSPTYNWWSGDGTFHGPVIGFNSSGGTISDIGSISWPSGELLLAPPAPGGVVLRWVAPSAGSFNITGEFSNLQDDSAPMYIQANGNTIFSATDFNSSSDAPFSLSDVTITQGEDIDFIVYDGGNSNAQDVVGVSATIAVPEPGSVGFLGIGGLMMLRRRRA
jgi:hypothetical protein